MDIETFLPIGIMNEELYKKIPEINNEDGEWLMIYLTIDRGLQEVCQLYKMFRYNMYKLLSEYEFYISDDFVVRTKYNQYGDFISINALTISCVSASKTLIAAMEDFEKLFLECDETEFKINYTSKAYREYFSYRLMEMVRNCSQHGSLPVSLQDNKLSFDIEQLLNLFHFKYKQSFLQELIRLREDVTKEYGVPLKISYMYCVLEYNYVVSKLYYEFWGHIKKYVVEINKKLAEVLGNNPQMYVEGSIGFRYDGHTHMIVGDGNIVDFVEKCKNDANNYRKKVQREWFSIRKKYRENEK